MFCLAKVEVEFVLELACAERRTGAKPCNAEVEFVVGLARPERRPGSEPRSGGVEGRSGGRGKPTTNSTGALCGGVEVLCVALANSTTN